MLLRNLRAQDGLCNGTRMIVRRVHAHVLDCETADGARHFIPRITLTPTDSALPIKLTRRQYPIKVCFAMTANKSQGQTLSQALVYLVEQHFFSHGQLYVVLSRGKRFGKIRLLLPEGTTRTRNVVYKEVLLPPPAP